MKLINLFVLLLAVGLLSAKATSFEKTAAIDIPIGVGWNKVLQLSNGNTFLFHFEARKAAVAKLYDSTRNEISSVRLLGKKMDMSMLEEAEILGIHQIGNEAVVFISQAILNHPTLIALRFNIKSGKLIEEKLLIEAPSFKKRSEFSIVKYKSGEGYAVFCMKDLEVNFKDSLYLEVYNNKHEHINRHTLNVDINDYDVISHVSTNIADNGTIAVVINCKKYIHYPDVADRYLTTFFLPEGGSAFNSVITKLSTELAPYYTMYSYNQFGEVHNLFLVNAMTGKYQNGLQELKKIIYTPVMLMYKERNLADLKIAPMYHLKANECIKEAMGSRKNITPVPTRAYTNKFGLTTMISEENNRELVLNSHVTDFTLYGDISITQINSEGEEIWGFVIPKKQFIRRVFSAYESSVRGVHKIPFRSRDPYFDWVNQFVSYYPVFTPTRNCYIIYNEMAKDFDSTIASHVDTITTEVDMFNNYKNTNAVCMLVDRKKEVSKTKLFEAVSEDESYAAMVEGADYDETTNTFASLLLHKEGDKYSLKLGWRKLE